MCYFSLTPSALNEEREVSLVFLVLVFLTWKKNRNCDTRRRHMKRRLKKLQCFWGFCFTKETPMFTVYLITVSCAGDFSCIQTWNLIWKTGLCCFFVCLESTGQTQIYVEVIAVFGLIDWLERFYYLTLAVKQHSELQQVYYIVFWSLLLHETRDASHRREFGLKSVVPCCGGELWFQQTVLLLLLYYLSS